ncbi:TetR/AcrR family transcriptional regulator [Streptomyces sp. NPDC052701]|uniref:TetR/AcrR family transcriptional regulator n=1 Tax=Streptomyces sp. NPDC052701 TaxID=3155533 RepID=UPI00341F220F
MATRAQTNGPGARRSAAASRRQTPAGEKVLAAASRLFYDKGIQAVGVELIAAEAQVTKKTLYDRFRSKDELIVAYLEERDERWRADLRALLAQHHGDPKAQLLAAFDALQAWTAAGSDRGCAFARACTDLPADHPGQQVARQHKSWLLARLREAADAADAADPRTLAEQLLMLHDGACAATVSRAALDPVAGARQAARVLIDNACGGKQSK